VIRIFFIVISIIVLNGCKNNKQEEQLAYKRPVLKILVAGLTDLGSLHAANIIGKEYGLAYQIVGGCNESEEFQDSLQKHNKQVLAELAHEFGTDWQKRFEEKKDSMEFLVSQAQSFLEHQTDYKKIMQDFEERKIILAVWTEPTIKNDVFKVEAYEYTLVSSDSNRKVHKTWFVDLNKRIITSSL
jgi:hypothetical protein